MFGRSTKDVMLRHFYLARTRAQACAPVRWGRPPITAAIRSAISANVWLGVSRDSPFVRQQRRLFQHRLRRLLLLIRRVAILPQNALD